MSFLLCLCFCFPPVLFVSLVFCFLSQTARVEVWHFYNDVNPMLDVEAHDRSIWTSLCILNLLYLSIIGRLSYFMAHICMKSSLNMFHFKNHASQKKIIVETRIANIESIWLSLPGLLLFLRSYWRHDDLFRYATLAFLTKLLTEWWNLFMLQKWKGCRRSSASKTATVF